MILNGKIWDYLMKLAIIALCIKILKINLECAPLYMIYEIYKIYTKYNYS